MHEPLRQTAGKYPTDEVCSLIRLREEQAGIEVRLSPEAGDAIPTRDGNRWPGRLSSDQQQGR